jgi:hypothetical protein
VDEVNERVRRDPELDGHEQKMLGCIVDPRKANPLSVGRQPLEHSRRDVKQHF